MIKKIFNYIAKNKITVLIITIYALAMISVIDWGIPNPSHPYNYHMDEWHQLQSIKALYEYYSPNVQGAANGTIFHFALSGVYLSLFLVLKIIDPFSIKSSVESLLMQKKLFEVLRLNTLIFGILSMLALSNLVKKYFKISPFLTLIFFTVTPLWLSLSNYFKYDIALIFWIIISLFSLLRYGTKPTLRNYITAGFFCSLALSTKISAIPLFIIYVFSFFYFNFKKKKKYLHLFFGLAVFLSVFVIFGIPDLILGIGNYREYLYSNLIRDPIIFDNFKLEYGSWWAYLLLKIFPLNFGYPFYILTITSLVYWASKLIPKIIKKSFVGFEKEIFIFLSMIIFILSLIPLELGANGNRLLVLLPFFAIQSSLFVFKLAGRFPLLKIKIYIVLIFLFAIQLFQSSVLTYVKWQKDPRQLSSDWIMKNVDKGFILGIENIPIYQMLPDLIVKEFYFKKMNSIFNYEVVDSKSVFLPNTVIVTNKEFAMNYLKKSLKKDLLIRLNNEKYKVIQEFKPNRILYLAMGNEFDFYSSGLVPISTITVFRQDKNPQN